jgi:Na+-driven multidrug efflux pump
MLRELIKAARGGRHDYTTGSIGKAIFLLAVPMVLEMLMESLFAITDTFWVGRLGANAVATIGLTETMMIIIYTFAMGLGIAASAIIARRIGEHDRDGASTTAVQALVLATVFSVILAALGAYFAADRDRHRYELHPRNARREHDGLSAVHDQRLFSRRR